MSRGPDIRRKGSVREALIAARKARYPGVLMQDLAERIGISRMHMTAIERGWRDPSVPVALRWVEVLGPGASLALFGEVPAWVAYARNLSALKAQAPQIFEHA